MARPRKGDQTPLRPLEMAQTGLTTEIISHAANPKLTVRVRATLMTSIYVRVAEATLIKEDFVRGYVEQMMRRLREGLDPLSGMDPVSAAYFTQGGKLYWVTTPASVLPNE